ncbi:hypothetical protein SEA_ABBYDAISY_49 [Arthrobacter phage AbbyDaisy]|nr:hypothetical protein SEA_ABBYDAISY_49 [Arthrobacter phage AbbyDaisy]
MSFEAKYNGTCSECEDRIHVGDIVTYVDDSLMHEDCNASARPERTAEVCTRCWLTKPCDCE